MGPAAGLLFTFACSDYDRVLPLMSGDVRPQGLELRFLPVAPPESFFRMLHFSEFDASEMSLSWYTRTLFWDEPPFWAIPAFPSRMFRHSFIYVNRGSGIDSPEDLRGKRVGCPEYQMTAAVWVKGILAEHYGVPVDSVSYHTGGLERPGRREVAMDLPSGIVVEPVPDDRTLSDMLATGEIDALYGPEPSSYRDSPAVTRLFEDYPAVEREYLRRTGIFPIMHTVVIRRALLDRHPWIARSLLSALEEAKAQAMEDLFDVTTVKHMLPWLAADAQSVRDAFGIYDWWPYGVEPNLTPLATFLSYSHEQGLTPRLLEPPELFFPSTLRTAKT
jgi:4,5-dihydroxyphthalate decarboxylase